MNQTIILIGRFCGIVSESDKEMIFRIYNSTIKNKKEVKEFHKVRSIGDQAKRIKESLSVGDLCCIEGYNKDKILVVDRITFLTPHK